MNVGGSSSSQRIDLTVPSEEQPGKRARSTSSRGSAGSDRKRQELKWTDVFADISPPSSPAGSSSSRAGKFAHASPAAGPSAEVAAPNTIFNLTAAEGALNSETWDAHYGKFFFEGNPEDRENLRRAPSNTGRSDASSVEVFEWETEWDKINRPEVEAAFATLEIDHKPNANEQEIKSQARKLCVQYHPDHLAKIYNGNVPPDAEKAANDETAKIVAAKEVALEYVRGKQSQQ